MNRLKEKVVVVTGASRGLGREIALAFAENGANCVLCARSEEDLKSVVDQIISKEGHAVYVAADVSDETYASKLVDMAVSYYGCLDIWVNNAGVWYSGPIEEIKGEKLQKLFEINTFGTIYGCREALKYMKKEGKGQIVNIISTAGKTGKPYNAAYAASKFAITGFTESLRNEAYKYGIRVTAIYPGGMKTNFFEKVIPEKDISDFIDPKEVAKLVIYFANLPKNMVPAEFVLMRG